MFRIILLSACLMAVICSICAAESKQNTGLKIDRDHKHKNYSKSKILTNPELFSKLGLSELKMPKSHHKKRLAIEARRHLSRPDDSNIFVIRLPSNPHFYGNNYPLSKNSIDTSKKVPVGFKSNGKPGKIYHWNLPVLKKIFGQQQQQKRNPNARRSDDEDLFDIKDIPTWENDTTDKSEYEGKNTQQKKSPKYYAPIHPRKANFHKYFPGNGKLKGFYVIKKKNRQQTKKH